MANTVQPAGAFTIDATSAATSAAVKEYSVGAVSGPLGSLIHGLTIQVRFRGHADVTLSMGAADALQLAEELRSAVHRREDIRLAEKQ